MAEEVVKTETQIKETPPEKTPESEKKPEEKGKLPDKGFFDGNKMQKWSEEVDLLKEEITKPPTKVELAEDEELCEDCPEGKRKKEVKEPEKKEAKPFKTIERKGEKIDIATEEEYDKLASQGFDYTKKTQGVAEERRQILALSDKMDRIAEPLMKFSQLIESGKAPKIGSPEGEETPEGEDIVDDESVDPRFRAELKRTREELKKVKEDQKVSSKQLARENFEKAQVTLDGLINKAREENPFDDVVDKESEKSITQKVFAGLVTSKLNDDKLLEEQDPDFQVRTLPVLISESAKDLKYIEDYYKEKFSGTNSGELETNLTSEQLQAKFPQQIKELVDNAVASYEEQKGKQPPSVKSETSAEVSAETKKEKVKGIRHGFEEAKKDKVLQDAMEELVTRNRMGLK